MERASSELLPTRSRVGSSL